MSTGAIICLVPNEEYVSTAIDAHSTLAYFGQAEELQPWEREVILSVAQKIAKFNAYYMRRPKVGGRGVFPVDPTYNDGNSLCYIDLIDWNVFPAVRQMVEDKLGLSIERSHGFTPHITTAYANVFIPDLVRPVGISSFRWDSVQVWLGDERIRYEIEG